jgi:hypothetical protein
VDRPLRRTTLRDEIKELRRELVELGAAYGIEWPG